MRGADLITNSLSKAGVKVIFSLSGNQIMPIYDACIDAGIRIIHTRHEGAAVYMAEAYAQITGGVGVAMVTAGPGFTSSLGPLYTVRAAESPVVLISGDSPLSGDGKGSFQELDQTSMSKPVTKLSFRPEHAEQLGFDLAQAFRVAASGRPGPVHLALPFDLLNEEVTGSALPSPQDFQPEVIDPGEAVLKTIIDSIANAERPVILTGPALNLTRAPHLKNLENALDAPVIAMESPRGMKDPGLGDFAAMLAKADVIVVLGKNIDHTTGFGQPPAMGSNCKFLVIDPDTEVLERARRALGSRMVLGQCADADATARSLAATAAGGTKHSDWRHQVAGAIEFRFPPPIDPGTGAMLPLELCAAVQRFLDKADDPLLIIDGGEFGQWAQACLSAKSRIINGPSGCIGGSICYALATKIARPNATVVALLGDGTAGFHFSEFETAHRYGTDFIAVIGHDSRWNAEVQIQQREYGADRIYETELNQTRYDLAAIGLGCHGEHVTAPAEVDDALARAGESGLPTCFVCEITGLPAPSVAGH